MFFFSVPVFSEQSGASSVELIALTATVISVSLSATTLVGNATQSQAENTAKTILTAGSSLEATKNTSAENGQSGDTGRPSKGTAGTKTRRSDGNAHVQNQSQENGSNAGDGHDPQRRENSTSGAPGNAGASDGASKSQGESPGNRDDYAESAAGDANGSSGSRNQEGRHGNPGGKGNRSGGNTNYGPQAGDGDNNENGGGGGKKEGERRKAEKQTSGQLVENGAPQNVNYDYAEYRQIEEGTGYERAHYTQGNLSEDLILEERQTFPTCLKPAITPDYFAQFETLRDRSAKKWSWWEIALGAN